MPRRPASSHGNRSVAIEEEGMKKRKILVLLLVAFLLISITACGSNKEEVKKR